MQVIDFIRVFSIYNIGSSRYNSLMKCENTVKIGDVVKSLDFVGHNDCYRIGVVVAVYKDGTFCAETVKRVWQGKIDLSFPRDEFYAPLPGNHFFDDLANVEPRVQVVA